MEQPLPADGACNLGSINLSEYVINPFTAEADFDMDSFEKDMYIYVRALDDVLEEGKDLHALQGQRDMANNYRNIGLGIMGYATMLMKLGIPYGSEDAKLFTAKLMKTMFYKALEASSTLAKYRGEFPKCNPDRITASGIFSVVEDLGLYGMVMDNGLRNCSLLSIAPSGSIGTMLDVSTGMEPYYALKYTRKTESLHGEDKYYEVEVPTAKKAREAFGEDVLVSAMNLNWKNRVEIQGIMQTYVDTAISSTVNVPSNVTVEELRDLYIYAWRHGMKGITIYREGSFEAILSSGAENKVDKASEKERIEMKSIPEDTVYIPKKLVHGCGELKVMVGYSPLENGITDVYIIPKMGQGCSKNIIGQAVLISQILRLGGDLRDIQKATNGIDACTSYYGAKLKGKEVSQGTNCPSGLLNLVIQAENELCGKSARLPQAKKIEVATEIKSDNKFTCPECGKTMRPEGGCFACECGFAKCGE